MGRIFKGIGILLLEVIIQVGTAPVVAILTDIQGGTFYSLIAIVILSAILSLVIKLKVADFLSMKIAGYIKKRSSLKTYYYSSAILSVIVNPVAIMVGLMSTTGNMELFWFMHGFIYIWWIPNTILWLGYLLFENKEKLKAWVLKKKLNS